MRHFMMIVMLFLVSASFSQANLELENISNSTASTQTDLSSDSFYNSGLDYYYKNEYGKAIWAFENALKINPSNEDAAHNLNLINEEFDDFISSEPKGVSSWFARNIYIFPPNFWFYVSLISGLFTMILLYFFFTPSSKRINNLSLFGATVLGVILVMSFSFSLLQKSHLTTDTKAVIINPKTNLLMNPTLNGEISFDVLEGSQLNIISTQDDWYELQINNNTGWILKDSVWVY